MDNIAKTVVSNIFSIEIKDVFTIKNFLSIHLEIRIKGHSANYRKLMKCNAMFWFKGTFLTTICPVLSIQLIETVIITDFSIFYQTLISLYALLIQESFNPQNVFDTQPILRICVLIRNRVTSANA